MTITSDGTITGQAQTGLTSPTYTTVVDQAAPNSRSKQWAVSALGGTQTSVDVHSVSKPFTVTAALPPVFKLLGTPNPVTGQFPAYPRNNFTIRTRKGVSVAASVPPQVLQVVTTVEVPAGSDVLDPEDVRAALSFHFGFLVENSAGIGDTVISGVL